MQSEPAPLISGAQGMIRPGDLHRRAAGSGTGGWSGGLAARSDLGEGIRYRVFNGEQDLTLSFYCADFEFSA